MRGGNWRLVWNSIGLCLPTVVVLVFGVSFYRDTLPQIEKSERDRVKAIYRETALAIQKDPASYQMRPSRKLPKAWKPAGKMSPGRWGFCPIPLKGITHVWYEADGKAFLGSAKFVPVTNYRLLFTVFGIFFLLMLVSVTVVGIRYFIGYLKARDDFLAATAHDLTTPLVGMRMMIGRNDEEAKRLNERMLLVVENIKNFLKLGGRRPKPVLKPVDVVALTKEAYRLFAADYAESKSGEVTFRFTTTTSSDNNKVLADETMLLQILWNLFGNDLKYAAPYGKVEVRFVAEEGFVRVAFVDEGPGMSSHQMKRAFNRYYRAQTVLESGKGGFGIGLCAAREFARAMGGDLIVCANSPKGCVFVLTLSAS